MSVLLGLAGALLLGAAMVPQAARLVRARRADDLHYGFIVLNLAGLTLLTMRSVELRESVFVAINLIGAFFWLFVFAVKALDLPVPQRGPGRVRTTST